MLDLDLLAERRAKSLNQHEDMWRQAVWSPDFQKLTQNMSDGEVEALVALCPSVRHLQTVARYLDQRSREAGVPPFTLLTQEAEKLGLKPGEWIERHVGHGSN